MPRLLLSGRTVPLDAVGVAHPTSGQALGKATVQPPEPERRPRHDPDFPMRRYKGGLLIVFPKTRKQTKCDVCRQVIPPGSNAWRPLWENIKGGLVRHIRLCEPCGRTLPMEDEVPARRSEIMAKFDQAFGDDE